MSSARSAAAAAQAPVAAPVVDTAESTSQHLVDRLQTRINDLMSSLGTTDFYLQIIFISICFVSTSLLAILIRKRLESWITAHYSNVVDANFLLRALKLLMPGIFVISLLIAKITFSVLDFDSGCFDVALKLGVAYLFACCVMLIVKNSMVAYFVSTIILLVALAKSLKIYRSLTKYLEAESITLGQYNISIMNVIHGMIILVFMFWMATTLSSALDKYLQRKSYVSYNARILLMKCFRMAVYSLALMVTLSSIGVDLTALAIFGGAVGVGVGLGLQKMTSNFLSNITLLMEKSIKIGDLIEIGGNTGWVRQINTRYTLLETQDGRDMMIPNDILISSNMTNWTHTSNSAQVEIRLVIDYASDPVLARELMLQATQENSACMKDPPPSCYLNEFGDNGMRLVLSFWISDIRKGKSLPRSEVLYAIYSKFRSGGIRLAQPAASPAPAATI